MILRKCVIYQKKINTHINYSILETRNGFSSSELSLLFLYPLDRDSNTIFHNAIKVRS